MSDFLVTWSLELYLLLILVVGLRYRASIVRAFTELERGM